MRLARPYTIAYQSVSSVDFVFVELVADGKLAGLGCASPAESVTGESVEMCAAALEPDRLSWLIGRDPLHLGTLTHALRNQLRSTPAARAAVDMALHDLFARALEVPLVDVLGRCHDSLPTSITVGILSLAETLEEVREYIARGFRCLKIKIGRSIEEDLERLQRVREEVGESVAIRVDANQGYSIAEARRLLEQADGLALELVEQPLPDEEFETLRDLPDSPRRKVAADESLHSGQDAMRLIAPPAACGIFNIKLMKCGGIAPALTIAEIARASGQELMWGCMDESRVSIAAALHAAYSSPATRYLDLDGSLDLAHDPVTGGFRLEHGCLQLLDEPGLGATMEH